MSDAVARQFANHWAELSDLLRLIAKNRKFEVFVLMHLDETDNADDLRRIEDLAKTECPTNAIALCKKLKTRIASLGSTG